MNFSGTTPVKIINSDDLLTYFNLKTFIITCFYRKGSDHILCISHIKETYYYCI